MARFVRGAGRTVCRKAGGEEGDGRRGGLRQARAHPIFLRSRDDGPPDEVCRSDRARRRIDERNLRGDQKGAGPRDSMVRENCGEGLRIFWAGGRSRDGLGRRCGIFLAGRRKRRADAKDRASRGGQVCAPSRANLPIAREDAAGSKGRETRAGRGCALLCRNAFHLAMETLDDPMGERDRSAGVFCMRRRQIWRGREEENPREARKLNRAGRKFFRARRPRRVRWD